MKPQHPDTYEPWSPYAAPIVGAWVLTCINPAHHVPEGRYWNEGTCITRGLPRSSARSRADFAPRAILTADAMDVLSISGCIDLPF